MKNVLILLLSFISLQSIAQNDFVISCWVSINDLEDVYIDSLTQHYDLNISDMMFIHDEDSLYKELTLGDYFCTGYHCFKYGNDNVTSFVKEEYGTPEYKMDSKYVFIETREYTDEKYGRNRTTIYIFN